MAASAFYQSSASGAGLEDWSLGVRWLARRIFDQNGRWPSTRCPDTFVISLANGDLGGYIVTEAPVKAVMKRQQCSARRRKDSVDTTLRILGCGDDLIEECYNELRNEKMSRNK
jgi:hypothetical protein